MKKIGVALLMAAGGVLSAAANLFDVPPTISIPQMEKPPVLDGKISPEEYGAAAGMQGFCRLEGKLEMMRLMPADARFFIGTDGVNLYVAAECETGPAGILARAQAGRGGMKAFLDDSFEFVFVPAPKEKEPAVYHLIVNNLGAFHSVGRKGGGTIAWDPKFVSKGLVAGGLWTFEMSMPLSDIGLAGLKSGDEFGLRVCRNWRDLDKDLGGDFGSQSSWEQNRCEFFSTNFLPLVRYLPDGPVVQVVSLKDAPKGSKPDVRLSICNRGPRKDYRLSYTQLPSNSQSVSRTDIVPVGADSTAEFALSLPQLAPEESLSTAMEVSSPDGSEVYYRRAFGWRPARAEKIFGDSSGAGEKIALKYAFYPSYNTMFLQLNLNAVKAASKAGGVQAVVKGREGGDVARTEMPPLKDGVSELLWSLPDLREFTKGRNPSGEYTLTVSVAGVEGASVERKFERKVFPWEGSSLGKSDILLPPFTPIEVKGETVLTILRSHSVNSIGLWSQVVADNRRLLTGDGMRLEAVVGGKTYVAKGEKLSFAKRTPTRVETESRWSAGPLKGWTSSAYDYDGMMIWRLTLSPGPETIDSLRLVIPIDDREASLMHACADSLRIHYGGAVPTGNGRVWASSQAPRMDLQTSHMPYIWLGRETSGISVFAENDKGWGVSSKTPAQELVREGGILKLVCNLVAEPTQLKEPVQIELGFQATPIKPMPADWRRSAAWGAPAELKSFLKYHMVFMGSSYTYGGVTGSDDIYPRDEDMSLWRELSNTRQTKVVPKDFLEKWVAGYKDKSKEKTYRAEINYAFHTMRDAPKDMVTFYTNARGMRLDTTESLTFLDEWLREDFQSTRVKPAAYGDSKAYSLDPCESYRDFAMTWYKRMLESGVCDNLYWDDAFLASNLARSGSFAYTLPDGRRQPGTGLYNMRELVRRAAILMLEMGRTPNNMVHMTNTAIAPILAFAQQNLDWEDHLGTDPFQKRYTREYIRALSIGRQFGNVPAALGLVTTQGDPKVIEWCLRTGAGVMLTHEIKWTKGAPAKDYFKLLRRMCEFGYGSPEVKVFNYWDESYPVSVTGGETSSIALSKGGEAVVVVCDYGSGGSFSARFDRAAMGLPAGKLSAVDAETGRELDVEGDTVRFQLKQHDFICMDVKVKK